MKITKEIKNDHHNAAKSPSKREIDEECGGFG